MRKNTCRKHERGMALILALLALLLISAVGLGMIYMSTTETSIDTNYKDTQLAFFAMRGGLEEMRDRMRANSVSPITIPTVMPGAGANSILYIVNPSSTTDVVDPKTFLNNPYFDDEFCHEWFTNLAANYVAPGVPCTAAGAPPAASVAPYVASSSPYTNTAASLKYKWVRITLKQNGTFPNALVDPTQVGANLGSQVCWNSASAQEVVASALGYPNCAAAQTAGLMVAPVYLVTAMAITPQGSRRVGQYESAALNITPPPGALALDGPAAQFNPAPHSSNYFANGNNSGAAAYNGPGGPAACPQTTPAVTPAISTGDGPGQVLVTGDIPSNRTGNYTGTPGTPSATPSVVNQGPTGTNQLSGTWDSPAALNKLASSIGNGADQTLTCGIGTPCSFPAAGLGTDAAPKITYVNGDFNFGSNSGAGVLVVTGTLNITGNSSFDGLILVIGQGVMSESGGGGGQFNGTIFLAKTNSATAPYSQLPAVPGLGSPLIAWNGGGTNGIQYNSCWANIGNDMHYIVVASREEMY
jgi:hypothetical protein